ncbi:MAG: hypothetical protein ABR955_10645 [Verrucomicrobiota bacterium]|jgi:hypothetical protein
MKPRILLISNAAVVWLLLADTGVWPSLADVNTNPAPAEAPKSLFVMPDKPEEGRDPFFPNSMRPYEAAIAANRHSAAVGSLELKGFSGDPLHRLVIINNHTFAEGDEQYVLTIAGRIQVRCIKIQSDSAIVEADGQRVELSLPR